MFKEDRECCVLFIISAPCCLGSHTAHAKMLSLWLELKNYGRWGVGG